MRLIGMIINKNVIQKYNEEIHTIGGYIIVGSNFRIDIFT